MNLTNLHGLPESIVNAIAQDPYEGPSQGDLSTISVTTLILPPKIRMLRHRHAHEIEEDVSDNIWRLLGSSVHAMLERAETSDSLVEQRIEMKVGDKTISGKTDLYQDGCVQDYKVTSVWSVIYSPEGKKEWTEQLNLLALLYREAGFEVNSLKIVAILRDWSSANAKRDSNYPRIPIAVIDVPLWTKEEQLIFLGLKISNHSQYETVDDDNIPECPPEDRWKTETKWAVYKNQNKRADKVCDTFHDAQNHVDGQDQKHSWRIEERPGQDRRCQEYCSVAQFCHYGKQVLSGPTAEMAI